MNSILLAATSSSAGMGLFKPLYWLFGVCMGFLMDLLNNQYFGGHRHLYGGDPSDPAAL